MWSMWKWSSCYRKLASVGVLSRGIRHLRSVKTATYIYTPKVHYYSTNALSSIEEQNPNLPIIGRNSELFIKPKYQVEESKQPYYLAPHDLLLLSYQYINFGLLFAKPSHINGHKFSIHSFIESLQESLSSTLVYFYPLAGRLVTEVDEHKHESRVYVDCNKGPGARFIHATLDMTISDILTPKDAPLVVRSFFDLDEESPNYDYFSCSKPLLSIQVTELLDGIFIACCVNHAIIDGTSYWHFWNTWSKIHRGNGHDDRVCESSLPVYTRWSPNEHAPGPFTIPFTHPNEFVRKFETPSLKERIFHFSSESISKLKAKANEEGYVNNISSFQALSALVWRSIIRANRVPKDQVTYNLIVANARERLDPPLPKYYFGNFIQPLPVTTTVSELLENDLGWTASLLHESVTNLNDNIVRDFVNEWIHSPYFYYHEVLHDSSSVIMKNSPRFDMYGNEFGLGKPLGFRTGCGNKANGVVHTCPGCEGGGSMDLEICLPPDSMSYLESDDEFMSFVSVAHCATISNQ